MGMVASEWGTPKNVFLSLVSDLKPNQAVALKIGHTGHTHIEKIIEYPLIPPGQVLALWKANLELRTGALERECLDMADANLGN